MRAKVTFLINQGAKHVEVMIKNAIAQGTKDPNTVNLCSDLNMNLLSTDILFADHFVLHLWRCVLLSLSLKPV